MPKKINETDERTDSNITDIRRRYPEGLHFVVGDTHGETETLRALLEKIRFNPSKDHAYFVGDYNAGGNVFFLLQYLSEHYQEDFERPGYHLIRGNHERELWPVFPLKNLPDILVLRRKHLNYYLAHAGMMKAAFDLINEEIKAFPEQKVFAFRLDDSCAGYNKPLRQIVWSEEGLYSPESGCWPCEDDLLRNKACIIHGHTPYFFLIGKGRYKYGNRSLFWERQHIFFSEDLQSFDLDSNVKGRFGGGDHYRGLSCVCLEVLEEITARKGSLSIEGLREAENGIFSAEYIPSSQQYYEGDIRKILNAQPDMKTISLGDNGKPCIR